jgi:carbohydrate-selective porin OprB
MGASSGRHGGWAFAFTALSIVASVNGFATAAWAQAQRSDEPKEPLQTTLSGDWGGLRPYLEPKGLVFTLSYTNDFLSNVRGGIGLGTVGIGAFQP